MSKIRASDLINDIDTHIQYKNLPNENQLESSIYDRSRLESTKISIDASDSESSRKKINLSRSDERDYGNFSCFLFYKNDPLIVIGPDWCYFILLSCFTFSSFYFIFIFYKNNFDFYIWLLGVCLYVTHMISYVLSVFKNPGIPSNNYYEDYFLNQDSNKSYDFCTLCKSLINMDSSYITYHCNYCNVCIEGYDHHCPWTTKCIGKGNLISFYVFVTSTLTYIIYVFFAITQIKKF
jgi:palmitoyltransferase ZDHHC9/14/18